jgi:uncharacterized protein
MRAGLPEWIEPVLLAERGARIAGTLALGRMERLAPLLAAAAGEAQVELAFAIDARGLRTVHGRVQAELALTCQRCLGVVTWPVDSAFELAVVASETEARRLPEGVEPLDCSAGPVATAQLVEDELLLALPLVASHAETGCNAELARWQEEIPTAKANPFDVLQDLKTTRRDD